MSTTKSIAQTPAADAQLQSSDVRTTWYFTFGTNHTHPVTGEYLGRAFVMYIGTWTEARQKMIAAFGSKWSGQYATDQLAGVDRWGLTEVPRPEEWPELVRFPERQGSHLDAAYGPLDELDPELVDATGLGLIDLSAEPAPTELTDAQQIAAALREFADFLDANPDLPGVRYTFTNISVFPRDKDGVAAWARAAMRATGKARKLQDDTWAGVSLEFGPDREHTGRPLRLAVRIEREEVCERVVTGTRLETKEVPDPEALAAVPLVTVTETVENVEWRCMPILAELPGGSA